MSPSVRGAERVRVVGLLLITGMATGGVVGFAAGALWAAAHLPALGRGAVIVAAVALAADLLARVAGGPRPLAVRRQVPQEWGRILGARTSAALYGARLGVGPLTILTSWLWWASTIVAASHGPWTGAAAGGAFHLSRTVTMLVAVAGARRSMSARMAAVQRSDGPSVAVVTLAVAGWLLVLAR